MEGVQWRNEYEVISVLFPKYTMNITYKIRWLPDTGPYPYKSKAYSRGVSKSHDSLIGGEHRMNVGFPVVARWLHMRVDVLVVQV